MPKLTRKINLTYDYDGEGKVDISIDTENFMGSVDEVLEHLALAIETAMDSQVDEE